MNDEIAGAILEENAARSLRRDSALRLSAHG
jgi:hypothetical protein